MPWSALEVALTRAEISGRWSAPTSFRVAYDAVEAMRAPAPLDAPWPGVTFVA